VPPWCTCCAVLQDFVHYVLKHSMVVLMTARDESTSFKIFSTLNGRGLDLAVIDKLKPELLQVCGTGGSTPWWIGTSRALTSVPITPSSQQRTWAARNFWRLGGEVLGHT